MRAVQYGYVCYSGDFSLHVVKPGCTLALQHGRLHALAGRLHVEGWLVAHRQWLKLNGAAEALALQQSDLKNFEQYLKQGLSGLQNDKLSSMLTDYMFWGNETVFVTEGMVKVQGTGLGSHLTCVEAAEQDDKLAACQPYQSELFFRTANSKLSRHGSITVLDLDLQSTLWQHSVPGTVTKAQLKRPGGIVPTAPDQWDFINITRLALLQFNSGFCYSKLLDIAQQTVKQKGQLVIRMRTANNPCMGLMAEQLKIRVIQLEGEGTQLVKTGGKRDAALLKAVMGVSGFKPSQALLNGPQSFIKRANIKGFVHSGLPELFGRDKPDQGQLQLLFSKSLVCACNQKKGYMRLLAVLWVVRVQDEGLIVLGEPPQGEFMICGGSGFQFSRDFFKGRGQMVGLGAESHCRDADRY